MFATKPRQAPVRNASGLSLLLESMADELETAGVFASLDGDDTTVEEFVNSVLSFAQSKYAGTTKGSLEFTDTLSKFTIVFETADGGEVTIRNVEFTYLAYTPARGINPSLNRRIKEIAGLVERPKELAIDSKWFLESSTQFNLQDAYYSLIHNHALTHSY